MHELGLVVAGIVIASAAMAVGIGGGILWTPLLIFIYGMSPQESIATSLSIQVVGMGSGSVAYFRAKLVEPKLSIIFFFMALPGVILGGFITFNLSQEITQMALGIMALALSLQFVSSQEEFRESFTYSYDRKKVTRIFPIPAFFGFIMGALSVGIGEWLIPTLRSQLRLNMTRAIATVVPMMFLLALVAAIVHWSLAKNIQLNFLLWAALGTLIGGQIGAYISQRIDERLLKQSFIYLMTLIGIHLLFQAI